MSVSRSSLALIIGGFMAITATVICCCAPLPLLMQPQPPWDDVGAQQSDWDRVVTWLIAAGSALLLGAYPLLAYGLVEWRAKRRASRAAQQRR
ncbi:hypothetical protein GCM10009541_15700 [Micromonospora gifhornensis]|uniref:Uncharacterized protein n=1 Tax=Micromonospora gifhornensis TaxID=84594 RepID=A0ABQ4IF54_9ACTN|nr:hypothetical protein Vgi01_32240 [Micromonospora gifhornensis]